jgi:hypothetical protein
MKTFIVTLNFIVSPGFSVFMYFVLRAHLWRQYYSRTKYCPRPKDIDRGDKMLAVQTALIMGAFWVLTLPGFLVWRHRVMNQRRRVAGRYADAMMHRFDVYPEEYGEPRRD